MELLENDVFEEDEGLPTGGFNQEKEKRRNITYHPPLDPKPTDLPRPHGQLDEKKVQNGGTNARQQSLSTAKEMPKPKAGHLVFRRRSTQIVIREIPHGAKANTRTRGRRGVLMNAGDQSMKTSPEHEKDDEYFTPINGVSWLCSGLYAMHVIILSLVICLTHYITDDISTEVVDYYFTALYILACAWLVGFRWLATSCYRKQPRYKHIKTNHTTNRWLKGILVVFGLGIIIENMMEFLEYFHIKSEQCTYPISAVVAIAQTVFVVCEVNFIFRFSKVCLQENKLINRFGVMHIIATNLSVWILLVVIESTHAINDQLEEDYHSTTTGYVDSHMTNPSDHHLMPSGEFKDPVYLHTFKMDRGFKFRKTKSGGPNTVLAGRSFPDAGDDHEACLCDTTYCNAVYIAQGFLYPFVIEFSLIASCMMYLVWRNIGKIPPPLDHVIKPSYKFFKSYKGFLAGNIALISTIVIIVVLNTSGESSTAAVKTYESEMTTLAIHNSFLVAIELLMIVACIVCFFLFGRDPRQLKTESLMNLDAVLLVVTLVGVITINMFYLLAVYASLANEKYHYTWIWGAVYPIVDMLQCVLQVGFATFGLAREPVTSDESKETAEKIRQTFATAVPLGEKATAPPGDEHHHMRQRINTLREMCIINEAYEEDERQGSLKQGQNGPTTPTNGQRLRSQASTMSILNEERYGSAKDCRIDVDTDKQTKLPGYSKTDAESVISSSSSRAEGESSGVFVASSDGSGNFKLRKSPKQDPTIDWTKNSIDEKEGRGYLRSFIRPRLETDISDGSRLGENSDMGSSYSDEGVDALTAADEVLPAVPGKSTIAVVAKTRVSTPNKTRLLIRDFVMFLLICNASLWIFWSLHSTAFAIYDYPGHYYDDSGSGAPRTTWTTITMICLPLSIFFRMHSSACLFEVWSFA